MSKLHTEESGDVALEEYGHEVEDEGRAESYSSQMNEMRREHVGLRLVAGHSNHLKTR